MSLANEDVRDGLAFLDGLELLHGAVYRGIEDQRRLTMEHDALPRLLAAIRAAYGLAEEVSDRRPRDRWIHADYLRAALDEALEVRK